MCVISVCVFHVFSPKKNNDSFPVDRLPPWRASPERWRSTHPTPGIRPGEGSPDDTDAMRATDDTGDTGDTGLTGTGGCPKNVVVFWGHSKQTTSNFFGWCLRSKGFQSGFLSLNPSFLIIVWLFHQRLCFMLVTMDIRQFFLWDISSFSLRWTPQFLFLMLVLHGFYHELTWTMGFYHGFTMVLMLVFTISPWISPIHGIFPPSWSWWRPPWNGSVLASQDNCMYIMWYYIYI